MNSLLSSQRKLKSISHLLLSHSHTSPSSTTLLSISFFSSLSSPSSSSSSSYNRPFPSGSRRSDDDGRNVRVSVWWDFENLGVPAGSNVFKISQSIVAAVRANGIKGPVQISAFGNVLLLSRANQEALTSTGINLIHIPNDGRNSADRSLLVDIMQWVNQNPPPAHIFLISSDGDFAGLLHRLRMNNYNILLAGKDRKNTPGVLCSAATIMWYWEELIMGENLSGKHFNQPPDGPFNSWYGYYRGPLKDPYDAPQQKNSSTATDSPDIEQTSDPQPLQVPKEVEKLIRGIVRSNPKGISVSELRSQLENRMTVDKNYYGFQKFSTLLFSMRSIIKVIDRGDGNFLIRPVSPKALETRKGDGTYARSKTEDVKQGGLVSPKVAEETQSVARRTSIEPALHVSNLDIANESSAEEKGKETLEKVADGPLSEVQDAYAKEDVEKEEVDARVRNPIALSEVQNSKRAMDVLKRLWTKWFGGSADNISESEISSGFMGKVISWFKSGNTSHVNTPTEPLNGEQIEIDVSRKCEDDALQSKKHELFLKDTFWDAFASFLRTYRAFDIVSKSTSRELFAKQLQSNGPLILRSLKESDLLSLVDLLISEKKWIKDFPAQTPRFKIFVPTGKGPVSAQPSNSNASNEKPLSVVSSSIMQNKQSDKSRSEILVDCQKLLDELLQQNPEGLDIGAFNDKFLEKYGYRLPYKDLGYPKLISLLQIMPGVKVVSSVIYPDSVVYAPGIASLGSKNSSPGSDSEMSDSSRNEDFGSPWGELGPVVDPNSTEQNELAGPSKIDQEYTPSMTDDDDDDDDDQLSDAEEVESSSSSRLRAGKTDKKVNEEDSSLLQILDSWHATKDEANPEGLVDCSSEETEIAASPANDSPQKQRQQKSYMFVSNSVESSRDKLIDGILGSLKKTGESRVQQ